MEELLFSVLSKLTLLEQTVQDQKHQAKGEYGPRGRPHDRRRDHFTTPPSNTHEYSRHQPPRWRTPDRFRNGSNNRQDFRPRSRNSSPYPQDGDNTRQGYNRNASPYYSRSPSPYHRDNRADRPYSPSPCRGQFRSPRSGRNHHRPPRDSRSPNPNERAQVDYRAARALTPQYLDTPQDKLPPKIVATINEEPAPQSSTEKLLSTVLSKLNLLEQNYVRIKTTRYFG